MIDLHSDTVTRPTLEMREAMYSAVVGDDVSCEDPTIIILEERIAKMFNKESALFFPSGTMSNLTALLTWCSGRGSEFIVGDNSHMFLFEQAGAAQFGGVSPRTIPNLPDGTMDIDLVKLAIRDHDIHEPQTKLICIENTHNACGGKILPISFMKNLK
jgi:threonine aldolase